MAVNTHARTLVIGGTGKIGRRVAQRLTDRGVPVRAGARSSDPPFSWEDPATWAPALDGVGSVYVSYPPDIGAPGAGAAVGAVAGLAVERGVRRLVLLSARGEHEALPAEQAVRDAGADWTIVRGSWFCQNFSEGAFLEPVRGGEVAFMAGDLGEAFVDAGDIADVAVAALTEDGHAGQVYELSGPRLLTFADAVAEIARATGHQIRYVQVTREEFRSILVHQGIPAAEATLVTGVFTGLLDGRNAHPTDGVQRVLGRQPRDFADFVTDAANAGVWNR